MNQNRELTRALIRHELSQGAIDYLAREATNADLAGIVRQAYDNEPLTATQGRRFRYHTSAWFRYAENVHYQYRHGLYDQGEFETHKEVWRNLLGVSAVRDHWCSSRETFSRDFRAEFETALTNQCID